MNSTPMTYVDNSTPYLEMKGVVPKHVNFEEKSDNFNQSPPLKINVEMNKVPTISDGYKTHELFTNLEKSCVSYQELPDMESMIEDDKQSTKRAFESIDSL